MAKSNSKGNEVKRRFTREEKSFVMTKMTSLTPQEISKELGRSPKSVIKLINQMLENGEASDTSETVKEESSQAAQVPANFDPQSNAKAPQGVTAGQLMAKRPGVTMMTSAASQQLDEFKQKQMPKLSKPHESSIYRIDKTK